MKRFLALAALVLGLASCQKDTAGFDVTVGGEQETTISVSLPEATRANSAQSGLQNVDLDNVYNIRYILEIYDGTTRIKRMVNVEDKSASTAFDVRLIPGYPYTFVAWADFVDQNKGLVAYDVNGVEKDMDLYYNTADGLTAVTANFDDNGKWVAMTEARDAYTGKYDEDSYSSASNITLKLKRPFAKLRVVTTDVEVLKNLGNGVTVTNVSVDYRTKVYTGFNALTAEANTDVDLDAFEYVPNVYTETKATDLTLLADYLFGTENGTIQFDLKAKFNNGKETSTNFNTDIPLERNKVTTIKGNILTDGSNIKVDVGDDFDNDEPNYEYETISSAAEFYAALNNEGEYIVISDIDITSSASETRATRATAEGKVTTINLNGKTITVTNKTGEPFAYVAAGNTLFLEGGNIVLSEDSTASFIKNEGNVVLSNGTLENKSDDNNTAAVVEGKVIVEENATVTDNNTTKVENWLTDVLTNGGTYLFTADMTIEKSPMKVTVANAPVIIDGNGYTLTCKNSERAIEIPSEATNVNVTIKNLNLAIEGYCQRGINFNVTGGALTIDNVKISENGSVATYALNLPGSSDNAKVTIKDSYLRGNIALNVWGENMIINATNTELVSYDGTEVENYTAICLNNDGSTCANGTKVNVEGGKIVALDEKGEPSYAVRNSTMTGDVTISASTEVVGTVANPVAVVLYEGYNEFYSFNTLQNAIDKAIETKGSVKLVKDITLEESVTIPAEKSVVIDLNGKTISNPNGYAIENYGILTIDGDGDGKIDGLGNIRSHAGKVIINGGTFTGSSDWKNGTYQHILKAVNTEVVINGGTFDATISGMTNAMINVSENSVVTINGGTFKNVNGVIPQFAPYMFTYEKNGNLIINDGDFYGGWRFNGETTTTDIYGGNFTVSYDGQSFNANSTHVLKIYGGVFSLENGGKLNPTNFVAEGYYAAETNGVWVVAKQDWKDYVRKLNAGHNKNSSISVSTGADFLPIVAVNPAIYGYSVYDGDTRIANAVTFRFSKVKKETISENSYKVSFNLAVLDENGNELEIKDGRMNPYNTSDPREHLNVYMNLIEVPADYAISQVKVGDTVLTPTQNTSGNCATGEYWIGSNPKDLYFQSRTAGLIEVTVSK